MERASQQQVVAGDVFRIGFAPGLGRPLGQAEWVVVLDFRLDPGAPMTLMPATVTCEPPAPSRRWVNASTTWLPTVRPNRTIHARGIASVLLMVPVPSASASLTRDGLGLWSRRVMVSDPSSCESSRTGTDTVFEVSPVLKVSVPFVAV